LHCILRPALIRAVQGGVRRPILGLIGIRR
jgi:hypothetical protein